MIAMIQSVILFPFLNSAAPTTGCILTESGAVPIVGVATYADGIDTGKDRLLGAWVP